MTITDDEFSGKSATELEALARQYKRWFIDADHDARNYKAHAEERARRLRASEGGSVADELEARGPGGWGLKARGAHVVIVAAILAGCGGLSGAAYFGLKHGLAPIAADQAIQTAAIKARMPESKKEHESIETEVRNLRRSSNRRECIELLDPVEKKSLRSNYSPYAIRALCPWLDGGE